MTLNELIRMLKKADPSTLVAKGFGRGHSYRGYYEQLAFEPVENTTIKAMLIEAEASIGVTYSGYKGGEYTMSGDSPVWIAEYGHCGDEITVSMVMDWVEGVAPQVEPLKMLDWPDVDGLKKLLLEYAEFVQSDDYHEDNDWKQYIYEGAINAFFGDRFWEIKNRK